MPTTLIRAGAGTFALILSAIVTPVSGQTFSAAEDPNDFGYLSQYNSGVENELWADACMPTSVINGLTYLNNYNDQSVFAHNPGTYDDVNAMATAMVTSNQGYFVGTRFDKGVNGLVNYASPTGFNPAPDLTVSGQYSDPGMGSNLGAGVVQNFGYAIPTASYIANALNAHSAVQLVVYWGTFNSSTGIFTSTSFSNSHLISIYSLNVTNRSGSAGIIVPESSDGVLNTDYAQAQLLSATIQPASFQGLNYLLLTYNTPQLISGTPGEIGDPNDPTPEDQITGSISGTKVNPMGIIVGDLVESVSVPEPSTWALLPGGLGLMAFWRRRA
jgi:hypothetical protein